uniref:Uncharacterized protein n=1 Tax=Cyprinodon variegatus TaxID=28743 RepID=A0A3Q2DCJ8_CYPVA
SLCEEAVSEGHTLPGPWETQELKPSEPPVQQEHQDVPSMLTPSSSSNQETQNQPDVKREEQFKGSGEGAEVAGSDVTSSVASDDGAAGCEVAEEGAAVKEAADAAVKSEGEDWSQTEDQEAVQAQKIWKKAIMLVWRAAANHRYASVFLQPVSDDIAPGYHSIVHRQSCEKHCCSAKDEQSWNQFSKVFLRHWSSILKMFLR